MLTENILNPYTNTNLLNFSYRKIHITLSRCWIGIVVNCSDQRHTFLIHLFNGIFKRSIMVFNNYILITWYYPFCPSSRCFCIINTFHSRQIQAFAKAIFPSIKCVRTIGHGPPYSHNISVCIFLRQMCYFTEVTVCIIPQFLNKARAV